MSRMNDFVFQMMLGSSIFEESQNECAAQIRGSNEYRTHN